MKYHVGREEALYVVPGLLVSEPIPWNDIEGIIAAAENYARVANRPTPPEDLDP